MKYIIGFYVACLLAGCGSGGKKSRENSNSSDDEWFVVENPKHLRSSHSSSTETVETNPVNGIRNRRQNRKWSKMEEGDN